MGRGVTIPTNIAAAAMPVSLSVSSAQQLLQTPPTTNNCRRSSSTTLFPASIVEHTYQHHEQNHHHHKVEQNDEDNFAEERELRVKSFASLVGDLTRDLSKDLIGLSGVLSSPSPPPLPQAELQYPSNSSLEESSSLLPQSSSTAPTTTHLTISSRSYCRCNSGNASLLATPVYTKVLNIMNVLRYP